MGLFGSKTKVYVSQTTQVSFNPRIDVKENIINDMRPVAEALAKYGKITALMQDLALENSERYSEQGLIYLKYLIYIIVAFVLFMLWKR